MILVRFLAVNEIYCILEMKLQPKIENYRRSSFFKQPKRSIEIVIFTIIVLLLFLKKQQ